MIKKLLSIFLFLLSLGGFCQIPNGYYDNATGSGYALKTQLKDIITQGHVDKGYSALYTAYTTTDTDSFYENDNTVLDMYSENPTGTDSYNYTHNTDNCGNTINKENDCYNREHLFPQGFFNQLSPMRSDIHHIVPTDGYVNGRRSNYPFGEVGNANWTSQNGSKLGNNTFENYSGLVFEPIDEFKGDIARMLLYFAVRYEDEVTNSTWDAHTVANNPLNGTNNQVYEDWYIRLLIKWHKQDPVSQREIVRNNEAYKFQGNRNPFIDHPAWAEQIWDGVLSSNEIEKGIADVKIYPNPSSIKSITISIPNIVTISNISLYSLLGKKIQNINNPQLHNGKLKLKNLKSGIYLLKISSPKNSITRKVIIH